MTSLEGAFFSAEDADSEGTEGKFYVWSKEEVEKTLGRKTSSVAIPYYNVTPNGNFDGKNIFHITREPQTIAKELGIQEVTVMNEIQVARDLSLIHI